MRILVTGHHGFIGQNLVAHLLQQGHAVEGWEYKQSAFPPVERYDQVIHLGAISYTTYTDVDQILEQNFEFSKRLINECNQLGVDFQYASSASVYGTTTTHFNEDDKLQPQSPYAWSKYLFDRYVIQHINEFNINIKGFRYFNVYGPGEDHKGDQASPYTKFTKQAKDNKFITLFNNSDLYKRDFVCVEDVCQVHSLMLNSNAQGIFNVGTGTAISFETVARAIAEKHNAIIKYVPMPDNLKQQYQSYTCANLSKINTTIDMNWTSIEDYINDSK